MPYRDIVDQHFPTIFFGPFSLPYFLTDSSAKLLILFLSIVFISDILLYRFLIKSKSNYPRLLLLAYILISFYFSGHILWVETFVNFFLLVWLSIKDNQKSWNSLFSGFLLCQVLLLRPTFTPALLFLFFSYEQINWSYFLGGLVGVLIPALYLQINHLWSNFYNLTIRFNSQVYAEQAKLLPGKKEMIVVLFLALSSLVKNTRLLLFFALISSLLLGYPRFGLEHLQPFVFIAVLILAQVKNKKIILFVISVFIFLNLLSLSRHRYGNYFYPPELYQISSFVKSLPGESIYLLGAPDLIYPLSGKLPPKNYYLPSLPWYLNDLTFQQKLYNSITYPGSLVLVDDEFRVDGEKLTRSTPAIIKYVKENFTSINSFGRYTLYQIKP